MIEESAIMADKCWRAKMSSRVGAVCVAIFLSAFAFLLIFQGTDNGARAWGGVILSTVWVGCYLLAFRPGICIEGEEVIVVNPLRTVRIRHASIRGIRSGYSGLIISATTGTVNAWAVQKMNLSQLLNRGTRSDAIAQEILAAINGPK